MTDPADIEALRARIEALEAKDAIRRVLSRYLQLCDALTADTPFEELGSLFTQDAVWEGRGNRYADSFGRHHGRAAIVAMLARYCDPPHFAFNAHFTASETIAVDGANAHGRWLMAQISTYSAGQSDFRSAELTIDFTIEDERWRIAHFRTLNLCSRRVSRWDDAAPIPVPDINTGDRHA